MDRPVIRCAACGGPLAPGALRCAFCGSQLAQAACPACLALVPVGARHCSSCGAALEAPMESAAPELKCPGCASRLGSVRLGQIPLRPCLACGGIWMARAAFEALAKAHEARDVFLGSPQGVAPGAPVPAPSAVRYRPCPVCGKLMNRMNYARISGVIIDACREDGFWFDPDELRRVVVFIESGGLDRAAARERQGEREGRAASPNSPAGGFATDASVLTGSGETLPSLVGEVLFDAARLLVKLIP